MLIQISNLQKTYHMGPTEVYALRGVDLEVAHGGFGLEVAHGEFAAIMGASGSGKSTMLHLLGCLDRPSAGRYRLDGREVESLSDAELSRLRNTRIGFVFQAFNLILQHNVLENVELPLIYKGIGRGMRRAKSLEL